MIVNPVTVALIFFVTLVSVIKNRATSNFWLTEPNHSKLNKDEIHENTS